MKRKKNQPYYLIVIRDFIGIEGIILCRTHVKLLSSRNKFGTRIKLLNFILYASA